MKSLLKVGVVLGASILTTGCISTGPEMYDNLNTNTDLNIDCSADDQPGFAPGVRRWSAERLFDECLKDKYGEFGRYGSNSTKWFKEKKGLMARYDALSSQRRLARQQADDRSWEQLASVDQMTDEARLSVWNNKIGGGEEQMFFVCKGGTLNLGIEWGEYVYRMHGATIRVDDHEAVNFGIFDVSNQLTTSYVKEPMKVIELMENSSKVKIRAIVSGGSRVISFDTTEFTEAIAPIKLECK